MMIAFFAFLLIAVLLAAWVLTLLGMPGNWLMVAATAVYAYFMPVDSRAAIGWNVIVIFLALAFLGEILELMAGAVGTAKAGGSKRGAALAMLGSIVGGVVGIIVGVPIPLVGPILAALLFAGLGASLWSSSADLPMDFYECDVFSPRPKQAARFSDNYERWHRLCMEVARWADTGLTG